MAKDRDIDIVEFAKYGGPLLPPYPHGHFVMNGKITIADYQGKTLSHECRNESGGYTCDICFAPISVQRTATVTPFKPKVEPSLQDEILQMLDDLAASIRDGKVTPSHLILGWAETTDNNGEQASSFVWDANGLTRFELIGHLYSYATKLANGEGE